MNFKRWVLLICIINFISAADAMEGIDEYFQSYLAEKVQEFTLDNGMKFILVERPETPVFTAMIQVKAGSVDEPLGKTGVAHVFEHMAFKGTETIGTRDYEKELKILNKIEETGAKLTQLRQSTKADPEAIEALEKELGDLHEEQVSLMIDNEFDQIYSKYGARFVNAGTGQDTTTYMVSLPKNHLELWARMEADRLLNPVFRQFYKERDVIMEERRMGVDNDPSGQLYEEFMGVAFLAHPYGDPVIGWENDIRNLTIADARHFHTHYYTASNITVALVGDIRIKELQKVAEKYFGLLPKRPRPTALMPLEPPQTAVRTVTVNKESQPKMMIAWHTNSFPHPDAPELEVAASVMGEGRTSRLFKRLILQEQLALSVRVDNDSFSRYPGLFTIQVDPRSADDADRILEIIFEEIDGMKTNPPDEIELQTVKKKLIADFLRGIQSNFMLTLQLVHFDQLSGDWRLMGQFLGDIEKVESPEIAEALTRYISNGNYTYGILTGKPIDRSTQDPGSLPDHPSHPIESLPYDGAKGDHK